MVQLKELNAITAEKRKIGFNSKMVQLKGRARRRYVLPLWFQFQNGTIKSRDREQQERLQIPFQFQNGTIKSGGYTSGNIASTVSIPKWYN